MAAHVLDAGLSCPHKDALLVLGPDETERWSYAQLRSAVLGTATGLLSLGLTPGDIVLMRLGNTVDFPIVYLGALAAGLVPVPTSSALTEAETVQIMETIAPTAVLRADDVACAPHPRMIGLEALRAFRQMPSADIHMGDPERLGYIIFTSGTAGKPRAVAHAHRAIWARQMMFQGWYGLRAEDRVMHAGAFNWTYTLGTGLMDPWTIGATALIPAPGTSPADLLELLAANDATIFAAAPGIYRQMLKQDTQPELPRLRHGLSAGEKLPQATADLWTQKTGRPVYEAYGMSECSTFISHAPDAQADLGSLGRPQPGRRIAVLRDGTPVMRGEEGTIAVSRRDPGLMLGYLNAPEATEARYAGEWFLTGDQAVMRDDGQIVYMGRADDMMNAGGFRVSPLEVESVLDAHPDVTAAAVTSVRIKSDVSVIAAFYTAPAPLDEAALSAYVASKLARYKQPRLYIHLSALPVGANGKILRRELRDRFERHP
jgi:acyl-coenzyme A synthetase/AMP-(fatty) acid ligase